MNNVAIRMILAGPYAGQNKVINGHVFENGVCHLEGDPTHLGGAIKYLATYQAYPEGSPELAVKPEEPDHGTQAAPDPGANEPDREEDPQGEDEPRGDEQSEDPTFSFGDGDSEPGQAGVHPEGDGHEGSAVAPEAGNGDKLRDAILSLDPEDDSHWTPTGKPKMDAVAAAYGSEGLVRADVNSAVPNWDRDRAREQAALREIE